VIPGAGRVRWRPCQGWALWLELKATGGFCNLGSESGASCVGWNEGLGTLNSSVGITFSLNLVAIWALDMVGEPRLLLFFLQNILGLEAVVGREL
jgi:hypothetical protein